MKHSTYAPISVADGTSTATDDVETLTPPGNASACLISVETTHARMTFDGSTPSATNGHVVPKGQMPNLFLLGPGAVVKWTSTDAADSIVVITWLS